MADLVPIFPATVELQPFFQPWMGSDYRRDRELSVTGQSSCCAGLWHVMGDSHYGAASDYTPDLTASALEDLGFAGYRFFDRALAAVSRKPVSELDRAVDWQRYAFSNFVQDLLPTRDAARDYERARRSFFGQLAITRPKQLLVLGKTTWNCLPDAHYVRLPPLPDPFEDGRTVDDVLIYAYTVNGQPCFTIALWVYHPSSVGLFNLAEAQRKVRAVEMMSCNLLSQLDEQDGQLFFDPDL